MRVYKLADQSNDKPIGFGSCVPPIKVCKSSTGNPSLLAPPVNRAVSDSVPTLSNSAWNRVKGEASSALEEGAWTSSKTSFGETGRPSRFLATATSYRQNES